MHPLPYPAPHRRRAARLALALAIAALVGCATPGPDSDSDSGPRSPVIPRTELFAGAWRLGGTLSPDGRTVAYVAAHGRSASVFVAPRDKPDQGRPVITATDQHVHGFRFSADGTRLLYLAGGGDERDQAFAVELASGRTVALSPRSVRARIVQVSPRLPEEVLLAVNDRDPRQFDLVRVNLATGAAQRVLENTGLAHVVADPGSFAPRYAERQNDDGGAQWLVHDAGAWQGWQEIPQPDALTSRLLGLSHDGRTLYALDSRGGNTAALVAVDTQTRQRRVLHADAQADIDDVLLHPVSGEPQAVSVHALRRRWVAVDPALAPDLDRLEKFAGAGDYDVVSRSSDDSTWVVSVSHSDAATRLYFYERPGGELRLWYDSQPSLQNYNLATMHSVQIRSRDGLMLPSYYSLPPDSDRDRDARPARPLPTVLLVHGGPWSRDSWGLSRTHQWLANRGYAVLSVNFRGSTGFGKALLNAGDLQWGRAMQDDLLDAAQWAVEQGIARSGHVAIMGASYGGYAVLHALATAPTAFACGVAMAGPSNLITLIEAAPGHWDPYLRVYSSRVGDVDTVPGRRLLAERSPLLHAGAIERPLLVVHGSLDPRVRRSESDQIVATLQARQVPVVYAVYPDEGHSLGTAPNVVSYHAVAEHFLQGCLGGESERVGRDLLGSSLTLPVGAERLPEVQRAYTTMQ